MMQSITMNSKSRGANSLRGFQITLSIGFIVG